jgi:hypothetical protein
MAVASSQAPEAGDAGSTLWRCQSADGSISSQRPKDGSAHFLDVCFSADAHAQRTLVDLELLGPSQGRQLQTGQHALTVGADLEHYILEATEIQANNRMRLTLEIAP